MVAEALGADKVDAFLYEAETESLVAKGTSDTPMGRRQHRIGLARQPLANDGPSVTVYQTGSSYLTGHLDRDPTAIKGVVGALGVRSEMDCPLDVADRDLRFLRAVARWVGMVTHRAELVQDLTRDTADRARRAAVDELISLLTPRQREVAALVAAGFTNRQIAERLILAEGTVARHVENILGRLGAENRARVAAWIAEARLDLPSGDGSETHARRRRPHAGNE
jgi:DNA-binding CsgD family transcriptional regulator